MHCQCLNGLESIHFSSPAAAMLVENEFNPCVNYATVDHLVLIVYSPPLQFDLYGHCCPQMISPQWSNARTNFPPKKCVGGAKFGLVSRLQNQLTIKKQSWVPSDHNHLSDVKWLHIDIKQSQEKLWEINGAAAVSSKPKLFLRFKTCSKEFGFECEKSIELSSVLSLE